MYAKMDKLLPLFQTDSELFIEQKIITNLVLQMSLYFNVVLFPIWFITTVFMLNLKFDCFSAIYKVVIITTITIIVISEVLRLYLGYSGNLEEKIPDLAGFWMLSILIQLPLECFLIFNPHFQLEIIEIVLQTIMLLLLLTELISGYKALSTLAKHQFIQFQLMQRSSKLDK